MNDLIYFITLKSALKIKDHFRTYVYQIIELNYYCASE